MSTDKHLFQEILDTDSFDLGNEKEELNQRAMKFLSEYDIPTEIRDFLSVHSFKSSVRLNHVYYYKANEIPDINLDGENSRCLAKRLLIIGAGANGDFVVIDLNTLLVGYLFHDDLWEDEKVDPRDIFISLECTIGQFYYNLATDMKYPVDGYEAEEHMSKNIMTE